MITLIGARCQHHPPPAPPPQWKAAMHSHTTNSDGSNTLAGVVEEHYSKGFDLLAITDHQRLTGDWVTATNGLTQQRADEIAAGLGRNNRGMVQILYTTEQIGYVPFAPWSIEHNTFLFDQPPTGDLDASLQLVQDLDGLAHFNHPGRYTGGWSGPAGANDQDWIDRYVDWFIQFPNCVGMEIINKLDGESANDRIFWDNLNTVLIPQGRPVWGFANDDSHGNHAIGFAFNMFMTPANTLADFGAAMRAGNFYAVTRVAHNEGVNNPDLGAATPVITGIERTPARITLTALHHTRIDWIGPGTQKLGEGPVIELAGLAGPFVRANVIGAGGVAFSQPFPTL